MIKPLNMFIGAKSPGCYKRVEYDVKCALYLYAVASCFIYNPYHIITVSRQFFSVYAQSNEKCVFIIVIDMKMSIILLCK